MPLPDASHIGAVHLQIADVQRSIDYYTDVLGLEVLKREAAAVAYPGALFMSAGGYHHHLGANVWSPGPSPRADEAQLLVGAGDPRPTGCRRRGAAADRGRVFSESKRQR